PGAHFRNFQDSGLSAHACAGAGDRWRSGQSSLQPGRHAGTGGSHGPAETDRWPAQGDIAECDGSSRPRRRNVEDYYDSVMVRRQGFPTIPTLLLCILSADVSLDGQNLSPITPGPRKLADLIPGFVQDNLQNIDPSIRPSIFPVVNSTINLASINS